MYETSGAAEQVAGDTGGPDIGAAADRAGAASAAAACLGRFRPERRAGLGLRHLLERDTRAVVEVGADIAAGCRAGLIAAAVIRWSLLRGNAFPS